MTSRYTNHIQFLLTAHQTQHTSGIVWPSLPLWVHHREQENPVLLTSLAPNHKKAALVQFLLQVITQVTLLKTSFKPSVNYGVIIIIIINIIITVLCLVWINVWFFVTFFFPNPS